MDTQTGAPKGLLFCLSLVMQTYNKKEKKDFNSEY